MIMNVLQNGTDSDDNINRGRHGRIFPSKKNALPRLPRRRRSHRSHHFFPTADVDEAATVGICVRETIYLVKI